MKTSILLYNTVIISYIAPMPIPFPFTTHEGAFSLQGAFTGILRALGSRLAARGAGHNPLPTPLVVATYGRLCRSIRRFASLLARFRAGPWTTRSPRSRLPSPRPPRPGAASLRLPRGWGWLLPLVPADAAAAGSQLSHLLAQPEMAELIAGAPTLGRILRPLARMLAIDLPPPLQAPKPKPKPAPARQNPRPPNHGTRRPSFVTGPGRRRPRVAHGPG